MEQYEILIQLIKEKPDDINFGDYGKGASDEWINKAQTRLNTKFPPSYIWWLKNYGGGEIYGEEIFSVYEIDFDEVVGGDIVYVNELNRNNKTFTDSQLAIMENNQGETYFFDLNQSNDKGEYPIYSDMTLKRYADNFIEFLISKIALAI